MELHGLPSSCGCSRRSSLVFRTAITGSRPTTRVSDTVPDRRTVPSLWPWFTISSRLDGSSATRSHRETELAKFTKSSTKDVKPTGSAHVSLCKRLQDRGKRRRTRLKRMPSVKVSCLTRQIRSRPSAQRNPASKSIRGGIQRPYVSRHPFRTAKKPVTPFSGKLRSAIRL
jgi:hypothetical protein